MSARPRRLRLLLWAGILTLPSLAAAQSQSPQTDDPSRTQESERPVMSSVPAPVPAPVPTPAAVRICDISLDAPRFLREAGKRGIFPEELSDQACEIDSPANQFFAGAERPCKLLFANANWLAAGGKFTNLRGTGQFSVAPPTSRGIVVTIPRQGGVAFDRVTLTVQVRAATCPSLQPADVLAN